MLDAMGALALASTFVYQLNGHVLKVIGKNKWVSPLALTWILHVLVVVLAPRAYQKWPSLLKQLDNMKVKKHRFFIDVVLNSFLQMLINYFWMNSSQFIPTQLTAAIYQAAIGVVYVISVLFMGEKLVLPKACGVVVAVCGVCLSSFFPPLRVSSDISSKATEVEHDYAWGCICALLALFCKVASQIFCKVELAGASLEFMGQFNIHMGIAHIYAVLPVMLLLDRFGVPDMSFQMDTTWPMIPMVCLAGAMCTFVNYGYQTVPVVRSPLFLCRFQVLGIIFAVIFDSLLYGDAPQALGYLGYFCILFSFALISGILGTSASKVNNQEASAHDSAHVEKDGEKMQ